MGSTLGRATEASVNVAYGVMNMSVNLYTAEKTEGKKAAAMKNCCPTCYEKDTTAVALNVRYHCENGHGPFENSEVVKGAEDAEGNLSVVGTNEEVKETRSESVGLEKKQMELEFLFADDVVGHFFPAEKHWIVQPDGKANQFFAVLMELMDDNGRVTGDDGKERIGVGTIRMRDTEHVVALTKWDDQMVFTKLVRPADRKVFPTPSLPEVSSKNVDMTRTLIGLDTVEFDADKFTDQVRERILAWKSARMTGVTVQTPAPRTPKDPDADLSAMLEAAVAAAKAKAS